MHTNYNLQTYSLCALSVKPHKKYNQQALLYLLNTVIIVNKKHVVISINITVTVFVANECYSYYYYFITVDY